LKAIHGTSKVNLFLHVFLVPLSRVRLLHIGQSDSHEETVLVHLDGRLWCYPCEFCTEETTKYLEHMIDKHHDTYTVLVNIQEEGRDAFDKAINNTVEMVISPVFIVLSRH
jgi:hypothetical protein